jgi:hypothetical protein
MHHPGAGEVRYRRAEAGEVDHLPEAEVGAHSMAEAVHNHPVEIRTKNIRQ